MQSSNRSRIAREVLIVAYFIGVAVASSLPVAYSFLDRLPLGVEEVRTVPNFNLWTIAWNIDSVQSLRFPFSKAYWDAPIFWPNPDSLAMSEPQPATMFLAPVYWATSSHIAVYNFYFLLSLFLNGWICWLVLRCRGIHFWVALSASTAMCLLPIVHWQAGVLQLVPIWSIIWTIHEFDRLLHPQRLDKELEDKQHAFNLWSDLAMCAARLALAVTATFWISVHHGLFMLAILIAATPWVLLSLNRRLIVGSTMCILLLIPTLGPIAVKHYQVSARNQFKREQEIVQGLSAELQDFSMTYGHTIIQNNDAQRPWFLSPGWSKIAMALGGLAIGIFQRNRWALFLSLVAGVSLVLSLGANLQIGSFNLWELMANTVPGFSQVRSAYRFGYIMQLAMVLLGAEFIHSCLSRIQKWSSSWLILFGRFFVIIAIVWFAIDPWPEKMRLGVAPASDASWVTKLKEAKPADATAAAVLILPLVFDGDVRDYEYTTEWMVANLTTGKPMVNGYSGFFPVSHLELAEEISKNGLNEPICERLYGLGVRYVVVQPIYNSRSDEFGARLKLLTDSTQPVRVFELSSSAQSESR